MYLTRSTLLAVAIVVLAAACGGSGTQTPTPPTDSTGSATGRRAECDKAGPSSLRAATCAARGNPSLDPEFSKRFVAPSADTTDCETTTNLVFYAADDWMRLA